MTDKLISKNESRDLNSNTNPNIEDPFPKYVLLVAMIILLALILGIMTNLFVDYFGNKLNIQSKIIFQVVIISFVIYGVKKLSKYIHHEPIENYSYDVIFISVYMSSQERFQELLHMFK